MEWLLDSRVGIVPIRSNSINDAITGVFQGSCRLSC